MAPVNQHRALQEFYSVTCQICENIFCCFQCRPDSKSTSCIARSRKWYWPLVWSRPKQRYVQIFYPSNSTTTPITLRSFAEASAMLPDTAFLVAGLLPYLHVVSHSFLSFSCTRADSKTVSKHHKSYQQFKSPEQCGEPSILSQPMG